MKQSSLFDAPAPAPAPSRRPRRPFTPVVPPDGRPALYVYTETTRGCRVEAVERNRDACKARMLAVRRQRTFGGHILVRDGATGKRYSWADVFGSYPDLPMEFWRGGEA